MGTYEQTYIADEIELTSVTKPSPTTEDARVDLRLELSSADGNPPYSWGYQMIYHPRYESDDYVHNKEGFATPAQALRYAATILQKHT